jgi:hypothetical protein
VFPSGRGLIIREPGWPGLPIYITYSAPFIKFVAASDSVINTPATNDEAPPFNGYGVNAAVNFTATTTNGSATLTSVSSTVGLYIGMLLGGTGIQSGTTISSINVGAATVTMSAVATANGTAVAIGGANSPNIPNMTPTMLDLPPLGAEIDLTLPREISRNFMESQPDPRKAQEVPAGSVSGSVNALIQRRMQRMSEEADRLQRQYTKVRSW